MPYELPEWAESKLRGVTPDEIDQVLSGRRKWPRPSTGASLRVTLIAGRTEAGRPLFVAVHRVGTFHWLVLGAEELTGAELAAFEDWEERTDEPFTG
ncbi:hypothetical protein [Nocardia asteroides]|uniref:hypothetical protein n=1 Tax=Nocardia asteroides TaxID=1824 RepID=UPI001E3F9838|nr:hypothetical protein [Nocardia asteroides]UGT62153.1 hypothetical protein LTT61_02015 [Nocardia asteroides]